MTQGLERETIYKQDFQKVLEQTKNAQIKELREKAFAYFSKNGFPTPKNEEWKYTNVAELEKHEWEIDKIGDYQPLTELVVPELAGKGSEFEYLSRFNYERNGFTALNLAFAEIIFIRIPKETKIENPIHLNFVRGLNSAFSPHVIFVAESGSKATILEYYENSGKCFTNAAIQIFVEENASVMHYRVQKESSESYHVGTTEITLKRGSFYNSTNINLGAKLSRHDVHLKFTEEGAEAFVDGLYMLSGEQHHDTHSTIDHALPNCVSHQTYKGVLNDRSRGVFNGKVFVRENASGTDAQQSNKNLLLSNDARVDTKPQLEIFNDDVKCSHGATVGQLEDEELFYLLSRGLNESLAKNLLTYGFAEEIVNKIEIESIKNELDAAVLNRLNTSLEA